MMYKIVYTYNTGDSYNNEYGLKGELCERSALSGYQFRSLKLAKEALRRMKEHYLWRLGEDCAYSFENSKDQIGFACTKYLSPSARL